MVVREYTLCSLDQGEVDQVRVWAANHSLADLYHACCSIEGVEPEEEFEELYFSGSVDKPWDMRVSLSVLERAIPNWSQRH